MCQFKNEWIYIDAEGTILSLTLNLEPAENTSYRFFPLKFEYLHVLKIKACTDFIKQKLLKIYQS